MMANNLLRLYIHPAGFFFLVAHGHGSTQQPLQLLHTSIKSGSTSAVANY